MINKEILLEFFRNKTSKPLSFREIVSLMSLSRSEARALKKVLREMLRNGDLTLTRRGLYGPSEDMNLVSGYFEAHRDGFGFVIPDRPGERDFFIPPKATQGAMNNDRVVMRVENRRRREGRIIRILERATSRVVGRIDMSGPAAFVKPKNRFIPVDLFVSPGERGKARHDDMVLAEILTYPTDKRPPTAKVLKVMDEAEDLPSDIEAIIDEFGLPRRFPKKVGDEVKMIAGRTAREEGGLKRKDLRAMPTVTIDGETAKDFDDAVSIRRSGDGYRLWVHIADVGHFVPWNSATDLEARKRGTSVYFPDRVIPMLPKLLSEDLCSLNPGVERLAFTVEMEFDRKGRRRSASFYPSLIKSDERMTYTAVRKILVDWDAGEREKYHTLLGDFELMAELCRILRSTRFERGSLDFDLPEPEIILDLRGNPESILRAERNFAHMVIEEFMIAANEAVAGHLESLGVPSLYRIHEEPDPMKMEEVFTAVRHLGRFRKKNFRPGDLADLLRFIKGNPAEELVNYVVLRSLKQARYSAKNAGHFGLASECYTHFTSPIRRYPDLVVHRVLREVLSRKVLADRRKKELATMLPDIAFASSQRERDADKAERQVVDAIKVWFMKDRVGEEFGARVVGITPFGIRVRLNDYYVEGFLRLSSMTDDFYQYDERTVSLMGRHTKRSFRIGDELSVRVDRVDMEEREVVFGL